MVLIAPVPGHCLPYAFNPPITIENPLFHFYKVGCVRMYVTSYHLSRRFDIRFGTKLLIFQSLLIGPPGSNS